MTKRDEAVFAKAFDELEAEGYFNELEKALKARELREKARAEAKPIPPDSATPGIEGALHSEFEAAAYYRPDSAFLAAMGTPEESKPRKRPRKKADDSVSSQSVSEKVLLAASKK